MTERMFKACAVLLLSAVFMSGCGGGGSSSSAASPSGNTPAPAPITGVSTPSSVAVVTAKNAS